MLYVGYPFHTFHQQINQSRNFLPLQRISLPPVAGFLLRTRRNSLPNSGHSYEVSLFSVKQHPIERSGQSGWISCPAFGGSAIRFSGSCSPGFLRHFSHFFQAMASSFTRIKSRFIHFACSHVPSIFVQLTAVPEW